jgi:site-specific recombinase XerD
MNEIALASRAADWRRLKALVLDSVSSPITKRVHNLGLDEFFAWFAQEPRAGFTKATVSAWRVALEARGLGSVSINVRITAVRKLAVEAADNGLLAPELAAGITRVKAAKSIGVRTGNWLSVQQAQKLLNAPDVTTKKGLRDHAMLAILLGCGLRRSEVAALTLKHIQQRDNRWCIVDLVGKHGRVRTIPMPTWVKVAIDTWTGPAGITEGHVLRPVGRGDHVLGERMTEKVVWQLVQPYALAAGVPGIAPHDLRRSCAKMCRAAGGELEQLQLLLGHASVQTTERYLGTKQDLIHAPNDGIKREFPASVRAAR